MKSRRGSTQITLTGSSPQISYTEFETQKTANDVGDKVKEAKKTMEINATSATETLNKALKGVGDQLIKNLECSKTTSKEVSDNTKLVSDRKIDNFKRELSSQIEGIKKWDGCQYNSSKILQNQVEDNEKRLPDHTPNEELMGGQNFLPQPPTEKSPRR